MSLFRPERRDATTDAMAQRYRIGTRSRAGTNVNDRSALALAAVWGCVDLISELVSTLPAGEYLRGKDNELIPAARSTFLEDPAGDGYGYEVWCRQLMTSLLLRGNAFGMIEAIGSDGWPTQITTLHPDMIQARRDNPNYGPVEWYWTNTEKKIQRWPAGPLWHIPAYTFPGSPVGLSPIAYAAETIGVGLAAQKFGAQWFGDGGMPIGTLESDQQIDETTATALKVRITEALTESHAPLVLGAGLKFNPIQVAPNESQFLETIKANADDVAKFFFRRPPGEGGQVTYANVEARSLDLLTYTLNGWMIRIEKALGRIRPRPRFVKINPDALVRVDLATRYRAHDMAIRSGWHSRNDVRRLEDEKPITDGTGDEYLWPPYATSLGGDNGNGPPQPA